MDENFYISLIYKQLKGELSIEELALLNAWLKDSNDNQLLKTQIEKTWDLSADYSPQLEVYDLQKEFKKLEHKIEQSSTSAIKSINSKPQKNNIYRLWRWAAAILVIGIVGFLYTQLQSPELEWQTAENTSKAPLLIDLEDGTKVWLNKDSKLEYPKEFLDKNRLVKMTGEAYFEVTKNPNQAFVIHTPSTSTTVLGTAFNLRDFSEELESTILVTEGKVRFESLQNKKAKTLLVKGNKAIFIKEKKEITKIEETTNPNEQSWKTQILTFEDTKLQKVIHDINRHFSTQIQLSPSMAECRFNARFIKPELENILQHIAVAVGARVEKKDGKLILSGADCH